MAGNPKSQRIRDPVHNLIEFGSDELEHTLWSIIQTRPFQRLRRIRQLGFSEFVFPGATHTRFSHSVGVFHTARQLLAAIKRFSEAHGVQFKDSATPKVLVAALVHDVGHGMFSHAFEEIGRQLDLPMAHHEYVSDLLIKDSEIANLLKKISSGLPEDVATIVKSEPSSFYHAIVNSQFDADRLDYMQRDRLMTGVQSSGIDATWLMANLEIETISIGTDDAKVGSVETLVLGPKAFHAAESYVLSLFQLYPNVYFHKTTRGAEKLFCALMLQIIALVRDGHFDKTGLPKNHPICQFAFEPDKLTNALALDDQVFWGALPMMTEAEDTLVRLSAYSLRERKLPKCIDIQKLVEQKLPGNPGSDTSTERAAQVRLTCQAIVRDLKAAAKSRSSAEPPIMVDQASRTPYKKFQGPHSPLNQIRIKRHGQVLDMAQISPVVASAETFEVYRAYVMADDAKGRTMVENIIETNLGRCQNVGA